MRARSPARARPGLLPAAMPALLSVALLAGCTADIGPQEASAAAVEFVTDTPDKACEALAPDTRDAVERDASKPCAEALADLKLPTGTQVLFADVAIEGAQVRFADQVIFLARFPDGWRITAAGCRRTEADTARPYECEVES